MALRPTLLNMARFSSWNIFSSVQEFPSNVDCARCVGISWGSIVAHFNLPLTSCFCSFALLNSLSIKFPECESVDEYTIASAMPTKAVYIIDSAIDIELDFRQSSILFSKYRALLLNFHQTPTVMLELHILDKLLCHPPRLSAWQSWNCPFLEVIIYPPSRMLCLIKYPRGCRDTSRLGSCIQPPETYV